MLMFIELGNHLDGFVI